jgi:hypothetical protein
LSKGETVGSHWCIPVGKWFMFRIHAISLYKLHIYIYGSPPLRSTSKPLVSYPSRHTHIDNINPVRYLGISESLSYVENDNNPKTSKPKTRKPKL